MSDNKLTHTETAQACVEEIRALREKIPNLTIPQPKLDARRFTGAGRVPPDFIELTVVAVKNSPDLVRGGATSVDVVRDLVSYAAAYGPVADELEALAHFIRHSVAAAKHKAGTHALTTYELTKRLAKQPETADLKPIAIAMRDALGRRKPKVKEEEPAPPVPQQSQ